MTASIRCGASHITLAALALLILAPGTRAQDTFPSKPVHLLVPFPPGGAVDIVARTLADELGKRWPTNIIIENRPGAGGTISPIKTLADLIATARAKPGQLSYGL
jgi:tripartite-type tricarboxylate transporter receptor subunit TctC